MYITRPTLYCVPRALSARPPSGLASTIPTRHIRIKTSGDVSDSNPPEGHVLDRKDQREGSLDPQAQNAKSSMGTPLNERPAYVHSGMNKGDETGGASAQGKEGAALPSLWERLKQLLGIRASNKDTKSGNQSGKT